MNLKHNENLFLNTWNIQNENDLKTALIQLDNKLNEITREVSFWDIFNVTQVLLTESDLTSKLALLNIGEAAIVNANKISDGNESRYRGDIAYRKSSGELIWIPAENKGIYIPSISYDDANDMLQIKYSYQEGTNSPDWTTSVKVGHQEGYLINKNTKKITSGDGFIQVSTGVFTYTFSAITVTPSGQSSFPLKPIIKFFLDDGNGNYEEFYPDYKWEFINNDTEIKVTTYFNDNSIADDIYMRVR